tara:strand:+ start:968 stop:2452 length:1485 start_codon:yes stop_codon:yes gene_type:complete
MPTIKPVQDELARREVSVYTAAAGYAKLMVTDDSLLTVKGGDYKVYRETLRDDQCASTFQQRRLAVVSREWKVDSASARPIDIEAADSLRETLNAIEWDRITDLMLYSRWYGHAVGECMWGVTGGRVALLDIHVRDRARFAYDYDRKLYLQHLNGQFELMPERKFWAVSTGADHDDSPYGLGLAHYAYWPAYFKRNGIKFWLTFAEKFGSPTAAGKVPAGMINNPEMRDRCLEALKAIASETAILIPEGMEVTLLEAARSGAATYEDLIDSMNAAIAKIIVGQTASTQGTPGKLGNDALQGDVKLDLVKADADLVCGSFNRQVARWLTEWNFPGAVTPHVWRDIDPPEDLVQRADRDSKIRGLGYEPTEEYIQQTYGDGWQKAAAQAGLDPQQVPGELAAQFAELGALAALKLGHRADQTAIAEAANHFAANYEQVLGPRVRDLLDYAEASGDYETFNKRLREMLAEPAKPETASAVMRGNMFARLMGALRQQR